MENLCGPSRFRVCIIGAGSVGQFVLRSFLAPKGTSVTLIDGDTVEAHNVGRQPLCSKDDNGHFKVDVVRSWLALRSPGLEVNCINAFVDTGNVLLLLKDHAVVLDCTDDLHVRYLIDDACTSLGIPLISGSVHGTQGQVVLLHAEGKDGRKGPSLRAIFPGRPSGAQDGCDMRSVPPELPQRVAVRMLEHLAALQNGDVAEAGTLELLHEERMVRFPFGPALHADPSA